MSPLTVVFDLDGTLVDTAPDLIRTLNIIFDRHGLAPVPFDEARTMIGGGAKRLLERGLAAEGRRVGQAELDRLYAEYVALYADHIAEESRPFPGLEGVLTQLAAQGARLAVCTNKLEWLSVKLLDQLDLSNRFAAICGQDTFGTPKPDPAMFHQTVARAGGVRGRAIMVGDSLTDIDTARAAGAPVIGVSFGYTETPVAMLGPDRVIAHYDELLPAIRELDPAAAQRVNRQPVTG